MAEHISRITDDMLKGRKIVLERSGLDVSKIDCMTSDDELRSYIKHNRNGAEKNENYLLSVAKKRFMPITSRGGMEFKAFYDSSPMTTGDSAEVALQLMEIGRGHNVRREVATNFKDGDYCDVFGSKENITISQRKSDIVVTHEDGYTTHVESKVGLTNGKMKKYDLHQELLADAYRLKNDPKTRQEYVIFRNANNGLSQLDDSEYAQKLCKLKSVFGDQVKINYEGKYLDDNELRSYIKNGAKAPISESPKSDVLQMNGEICSAEKNVINNYIDSKVKSVNGCHELQNNSSAFESNSRSKVRNYGSTYIDKPSVSSQFLSDIKAGALQGAKYGAINGGVHALCDLIEGGKPKEHIIIEVLENTAKSAIKSGLISGATNLAQNLASKTSSKVYSKILSSSAKAFVSFCNGGMTAEGMLQSTMKSVASKGLTYAQSKIFGSTVSSMATASASASAGAAAGTSAGFSVAGALKFAVGAFVACSILGLLFGGGDGMPAYNDPRVSTFVEIDETGHCKIASSTNGNLVAKLMSYNNKLDELNEKTRQIERDKKVLKDKAQAAIDNELKELHDGISNMQEEILRISKRKSIENVEKYRDSLRKSVEDYVKRGMIGMQMQNAKINDLLAIEKQMQDEKFCCEHITNTCKQIISMGKRSDYSPEIRELVNALTEVTANSVTYRTNHFVTGADILRGCLA